MSVTASIGSVPLSSVPLLSNALLTIRTSTDYNSNHKNVLLNYQNNKSTSEDGSESWSSSILDKNQYIVFGSPNVKEIVALSIQGRGDHDQWVTSFKLRYSLDNVSWSDFNSVLPANTDRNSIVTYVFSQPLLVRSIAIHPESWHNYISLRAEVYSKPAQPETFVQVGKVSIGDRSLNTGSGERRVVRKVKFDHPFLTIPKVVVASSLVDAQTDGGQMRWKYEVENITKEGFDAVFVTWGNNQIYDLRIEYTAVQTI